ncbi:MAG: hypothetical protein FJ100_18595 [Deltaproteobacteria bacterium]|nr:hypothetical protein [Deltaproteobacteria bacterium]
MSPTRWSATLLLLLAATALGGCEGGAAAGSDASGADAAAHVDGSAFDPKVTVHPAGALYGATARYDLAGKDWHALPFPTDLRRSTDGSLNLDGFPAPKSGEMAELLKTYLTFAKGELRGFSVQPTVYVEFSAPIDPKKLPGPLSSSKADSPILLVDVDDGSPGHGKPTEVRTAMSPTTRGMYLVPNLLMVQPVWGKPLRASTVYALVVRRSMVDASGKVLSQPKVLTDVFAAWKAGKAPADAATAAYALTLLPLRKAIEAGKVAVPYDDIAAATVFSTGNPTGQLTAMATWVRQQWKPDPAVGWKVAKKTTKHWLLEASYRSPNFQHGKCPYQESGSGGFEFDGQGNPKIAVEEMLRVSVLLPVDRPNDVGGKTPLVLSAHGTGGDWMSYVDGGKFKISDQLGAKGLAIASIDQPMHGPRCDPPLKDEALDAKTFNFLNITAGRSGFRQSALDSVAMARMARQGLLDVPAEFSPDGKKVSFDPARLMFIGHSQGGLSGSLLAAIEPEITTFVLSGAGAGLSLTIMQRKDPLDIAALVSTVMQLEPGELSESHPAISLVQALADATDPLAYGHLVFSRPAGVEPPNLLLTEGLLDKATPADTSEALAACMGLDVLGPKVHFNEALLANNSLEVFSPVQDNLTKGGFGVTGVVSQWAKLDHFAIFTSQKVADLYTEFLHSAAQTGVSRATLAP